MAADTRVEPLPAIDIRSADYDGVRVWRASRPLFDNSKVPERGVDGLHVHAYAKDGGGKKAVDDTFEAVTVDGALIAAEADTRIESLLGCAKCGDDHAGLTFVRLAQPIPAPPGFQSSGYMPAGECLLKEVAVCPKTFLVIGVWHADEWKEAAA